MSWSETRELAQLLGRRHAWFNPAALYAATVESSSVLAYLHGPGVGWTVVIEPSRDPKELACRTDPRVQAMTGAAERVLLTSQSS
jgi:hypothetical protein